MRTARPVTQWAAVLKTPKSEMIHELTVDINRSGAFNALVRMRYNGDPTTAELDRMAGKFRLARVIISIHPHDRNK
jgi:hypothetical protein